MSLLVVGISSVGPSVGPKGGINATHLALGDAPDVAAPADIVGGVIEPPAPDNAAATPDVAEAGDLRGGHLCRYRFGR